MQNGSKAPPVSVNPRGQFHGEAGRTDPPPPSAAPPRLASAQWPARGKRPRSAVAGSYDGDPPGIIDLLDDVPGSLVSRAGSPTPARASEDFPEPLAPTTNRYRAIHCWRPPATDHHRFGIGIVAAAEQHGRVLGAERGKTPKRRALDLDGPAGPRGHPPRCRQPTCATSFSSCASKSSSELYELNAAF